MNLLEFRCRLRYPSGFQIDADFTTHSSITALSGPSGSGKTSILSMIAGLRCPDHGTIRVGERTLVDTATGIFLSPEARRIGYVFQDHLLFPHLSVRRNLLYGWRRRRGTRSTDFQRVVSVLELEELLDRWPYSLSGGQRQRVSLGRALLYGPDLLLLDEPLASVEEELRYRVLTYIERILSEWRIPTLYVSHNADELKRLAHEVIVLRQGRVVDSVEHGV